MSTHSEEELKTASPDSETPPEQSVTDRLSDAFQQGIKVVIGSNRKPPRRFKTLLHGTWLGHPLHPAITDVPIGAWLLAGLFDVLWLAAPSQNQWAARGAEWLVIVGIVGAVAAAVTGMADWSDTYGAERTVGLYHGALNTLALVLFIISAVLRFTVGTGYERACGNFRLRGHRRDAGGGLSRRGYGLWQRHRCEPYRLGGGSRGL